MIFNSDKLKDPGWKFDNSFLNLPKVLYSKIDPIRVQNPKLIIFNNELSEKLGLNFNDFSKNQIAEIFSGNELPKGSKSIAQSYAGHQFGHFTILGDGRATLLGEHISPLNKRFDIQLKGSGKTPYSRGGDGRATLSSMLREYLMSETMFGLGVPTTRSLSVVETGESVQREKNNMGSVLTRVADSHIRVGTFQYLAMKKDFKTLELIISYSLKRHFSKHPKIKNNAITLLNGVIDNQISLIINWMRVGFIHGVMNTDNMAISGETIDYGPCSFMDVYDPMTCYSSIDLQKRYAFVNQPIIAHWNLSRFAETLIPFLDKDENKSLKIGENIINNFSDKFKSQWIEMMKKKLGLFGSDKDDEKLIKNFLNWMNENKADYTNTFCYLMNDDSINKEIYKNNSFVEIQNQWKKRLKKNKISNEVSIDLMKSNNPLFIPRNHNIEMSIKNKKKKKNFDLFNSMLDIFKEPYTNNNDGIQLKDPPNTSFSKDYKTYCGT